MWCGLVCFGAGVVVLLVCMYVLFFRLFNISFSLCSHSATAEVEQ